MDPLEERIGRLLRDDRWRLPADPDALDRVHAGAARRRVRRNVVAGVAAAMLVVVGLGGIGYLTGRGPTSTVADDGRDGGETSLSDTSPSSTQSPDRSASPYPGRTESEEPTTGTGEPGDDTSPSTPERTRRPADGSVPEDFSAVSMTAASANTYWVLGDAAGASVAVTSDGGASFEELSRPDADVARGTNERDDDTVHDIRFAADATNGWAYGDALWATHDAGRSWSRVDELSGGVDRLETAGAFAFALVRDGRTSELWRTPIGSDDWEQLDLELNRPGDLAVTDQLVAVTDRAEDDTFVEVSDDDGDGFHQRKTPCTPDLSPGELSATAGTLWLLCPTGTAASVNVSNDGGRKWADVPSGGSAVSASGSALGARSADRAIVAVLGEARILGPDGPTKATIPGLGQPAYAGFTTDSVGYVLDVEGQLFRTADGGSRWTRIAIE